MPRKNSNTASDRQAQPRLAERLQESMQESLAWANGGSELKANFITLLNPPPTYDAARVRALRTDLGFSQPYFSRLLNVSPKTVQSWEQGTRTPSQASARLLQLIENPSLLDGLRQRMSHQP